MRTTEFNTLCAGAVRAQLGKTAEREYTFNLPRERIVWAYPAVMNEQLFMLSEPILVSTVCGISDVYVTESGGVAKIGGKLSAGIRNVVAKISTTGFVSAPTDAGERISVSKEWFESKGGMTVDLKVDEPNYISVYTEIEQNGQRCCTVPVPVGTKPLMNRRKIPVYFALDYKVSSARKFNVTVRFSSEEPLTLPALQLRKGTPRPMNRSQGESVGVIQPVTLKKGMFSKNYTGKVEVTSYSCPLNTSFALFIDDTEDTNVFLREVRTL
jgi:hypothetical protein